MNNPIATLIYLRSAASEEDAILLQRHACLDHAATQGWVVLDVLADNGASGTGDREGFNTLCERVKARQADVVLAQDPTRISRDLHAFAAFQSLCDANEVRLAFASGNVTDGKTFWQLMRASGATNLRSAPAITPRR